MQSKTMAAITPLLKSIRRNLSDDLLKPEYRKKIRLSKSAGHCYVATEALYHSLSDKQREFYKPHYLKVNGVTHWYLMNKNRDTILDPTSDQFKEILDYSNGIGAGFLTKTPSKRTLILLKRINK